MADDIDIEEHDLLHFHYPQVAGICLQCLNFKSERMEYEENPQTQESPPQTEDSRPQNQPNMVRLMLQDCGEKLNTSPHFCKECQILFATRNDIDAHNMAAHSFLVLVENPKTQKSPPQTEDSPPQNQPNMVQLMLEDCGEKLNRTPRYCKECQILFATRNDIDAQNMAAHSFLVPVENIQTPESPTQTEDRPLQNQPSMVRLMLEDCGERLYTSPCFCKECQILFATRNDIDAHNMAAHSFLVPVENIQTPESLTQTEDRPLQNQPSMVRLMLEDCGERLYTSPCFCKECQILFATRNDIDAHNMAAHSFLVPVENIQTPESPTQTEDRPPQNQRNMVRLMLEDCGEKLNRTPRYCKECQTLFATRNAIDAHNMAEHSFLVPVENLQTPESPPQKEDTPPPNQPYHINCNTHLALKKRIENNLRMKYEMLIHTWNFLYVCEWCDVTTDSYDDVIDHCQNHYNDMQSFNVTIKNCQQCFLIFEDKCYNKHQELHSIQEIDRSSFTILKYDYTKLLTNAWFEIFNSLPSEKVMHILKHTIYATRLVKMKLLQSGPPEYTIYKCQKCEEIVARDEISIHTEARSCRKQPPKHTCMHCGLAFANIRAMDTHILIHNQHTVTVNSFRIVAFNHSDEIAFNAKLRSESSISEIPRQNISNTPKKGYKCVYYRCEKCYCSTSKFCNTVRHVCPVEKDTRLCHNCNNVFHCFGFISHSRKHDMTGMIGDDIVIKPFNANIKPGEWRVDLYECKNCKTKFPTYLLNSHQCRIKATKRIQLTFNRCKTCKELFSSKENREKHSKTCYTGRRKCIFKCKKCSRFMLSRADVHYHTSKDSEDKTVIKPCKYCGWKFTPWSLHKHIKLHHQSLKLTPNDFCIEVIDTHCGALANVNKKNQKQLTNVSKDNIKPIVVKKAKEASAESSTCDMKPAITTYKSRKERLMDRTLKKETNTENVEAYVKINVNMGIEEEHKVEQKKSSETNKKAGHNTIQYDKVKNADSEQSLVENCSIDQTNNKKPSQTHETLPQPKTLPMLNYAATNKYTHKIYKCGHCKVYFMAQFTCYIHMLRHTPMEAKEFIECKLCNLPFKIISLNTHMRKHHKENFNLNEVLVTEYTNDGGNTPKFQIYYATDKVQSRLVSTTSDEPNLERYIESNSQPSSSSFNAQTSDDVVGTSQVDTFDATMDAQPTISLETVDDNTDTNDDVVDISQSDTSSDVTINIQPSVSSESDDDSTDEIEDIIIIDIEKKTNADVEETSQSDTSSDVTMNNNLEPSVISVSSESDDDSTDEIEDINSIGKEENAIKSHRCQFSGEKFKSNTSKEFHESLDHLDGERNCIICDQTFNASILYALHLNIKNNTFECCLCAERFDVHEIAIHAVEH